VGLMKLTFAIIGLLALADMRVQRLQQAGRIPAAAKGVDIAWLAFVRPAFRVLWAGMYEMIRSVVHGSRGKPPFGPFLLAWVTGKAQPIRRVIRVRERGVEREIGVSEWIRPPRPLGRPRKYAEGWQAHRRTGRPRGRPRKQPSTGVVHHDQQPAHAVRGRRLRNLRRGGAEAGHAGAGQCHAFRVACGSCTTDGPALCHGTLGGAECRCPEARPANDRQHQCDQPLVVHA